jgi:hypothetical protein
MKIQTAIVLIKTTNVGATVATSIPATISDTDIIILINSSPTSNLSLTNTNTSTLIISPEDMQGPVQFAVTASGTKTGSFATTQDDRYFLKNASIGTWQHLTQNKYLQLIPMSTVNSSLSVSLGMNNLGRDFTQTGSGVSGGSVKLLDLLSLDNKVRIYQNALCFSLDILKKDSAQPDASPLYIWRDSSQRWVAAFSEPVDLSVLINKQIFFLSPSGHANNSLCFPTNAMTWVRQDSAATATWKPTLYTSFTSTQNPSLALSSYFVHGYNCSIDLRAAYGVNGIFTGYGMFKQDALRVT